jgi:ADP-ribose pyrophosphatase
MNRDKRSDQNLTVHASGRFLRLVERDHWEYASRANASGVVILVPVTDDDCLILVEQFRTPVQARVIELPAGLVGDLDDREESLISAARRELLEETGFEAGAWSMLLQCPSSSGMSDEIVTFMQARELRRTGPGGGDESEDIQVHCIPLVDVDGWLKDRVAEGLLVDPKIYSALYWLKFPQAAPSLQDT